MVRFRELYKLDKVSLGVATVSVRSEMITIITEPKEEAQVLQQLSNGTVRFDMQAGRMISKDLTWDKRVVDFAGPGSSMEYNSRLSEEVTNQNRLHLHRERRESNSLPALHTFQSWQRLHSHGAKSPLSND